MSMSLPYKKLGQGLRKSAGRRDFTDRGNSRLGLEDGRVSGNCSGRFRCGWRVVGTPVKGAMGAEVWVLEEQAGVSYPLFRVGRVRTADPQAIRDSESRVPGSCPRARCSSVAPGSQSLQPIFQQGSRG